ncbi:MAG TPA: hypothetical protein VGT24_13240 [Candidatus Acidoferrales bacterium]|nr:hypothetical protein [Candidatus Acidoferrales bacterium]
MNLKLARIMKYAQGSAPFAGIPIEGVGTIVLLRHHLRAALDIQPARIVYNQDTKVLTFRNHRAEWRLNDLLGQGKVQRWQIHDHLRSWANGRRSAARKRKETAALGKEGRYVRRLREAITKLTRQRDKIYLRKPENPLKPKHWEEAGDYGRNQATAWVEEKLIRKALAQVAGRKLIHGEPKTWADFYRDVEKVSGRHVDESQTFTRVHARKRYRHGLSDYPDREDYLKNLPRYLGMSEKPWDWRPYDPYKKDEYGEQLNALERHAQARREYCASLRERKALDSQITGHLAEIASLTQKSEGA